MDSMGFARDIPVGGLPTGTGVVARSTYFQTGFETAADSGLTRGLWPPAIAGVLLAFHKPYGVLSQFTPDGSPNRPLAQFNFPKGVYPIGRLDADSEGLLLLSDEPALNDRLLHPRHAHARTYWVQVERLPTDEAQRKLAAGLMIQGERTLP